MNKKTLVALEKLARSQGGLTRSQLATVALAEHVRKTPEYKAALDAVPRIMAGWRRLDAKLKRRRDQRAAERRKPC